MTEELMKAIADSVEQQLAAEPKKSIWEQVELLDQDYDWFQNHTCPFHVGQLVTPKRDSDLKWRGRPHKVYLVESNVFQFRDDGDPLVLSDMVVGVFVRSTIKYYSVNSRYFEEWKLPHEVMAPEEKITS